MKKRTLLPILLFGSLLFGTVGSTNVVEATTGTGNGSIEFEGEYTQEVYDPENPNNVVDPGDSPSTKGLLRIDFVPQLQFGTNKASSTDASYSAFAQLFKDDTSARGNFVQVSDYRTTGAGWQLSVKQESQFTNENGKSLDGSILSLDHSWANSAQTGSEAPIVKKDVINMAVGEAQILATAEKGTGEGSWSINFGASAANSYGQKDTLTPLMDVNGNPVLDSNFGNKPIYLNSAVNLNVPGKTEKEAGTTYKTVLIWTLSELP